MTPAFDHCLPLQVVNRSSSMRFIYSFLCFPCPLVFSAVVPSRLSTVSEETEAGGRQALSVAACHSGGRLTTVEGERFDILSCGSLFLHHFPPEVGEEISLCDQWSDETERLFLCAFPLTSKQSRRSAAGRDTSPDG